MSVPPARTHVIHASTPVSACRTSPRLTTVPLTVPLLCPARRGRLQPEDVHQVQRRTPHVALRQRRPQVDHVPIRPALRVEALIDVRLQVHAERPTPTVAAVDRTRTPSLRARPLQTRAQTQVVKDPA